jgi:putative nucleotidyltransferase with HDIG domain
VTTRTHSQVQNAAVEDFAHALVLVALNAELHPPQSQYVQDALADLVRSLHRAGDAGIELPLRLEVSNELLHHEGQPLPRPSLQAGRLLRACTEREIAVLAFDRDLDEAEAQRFFDLLLLEQNKTALARRNRDRALLALGIKHVSIVSRIPGDPSDRRRPAVEEEKRTAMKRYQDLASCLQQNHVLAHRDQSLSIDAANGVVERAILHLTNEPSGLLSLATQDQVDRFTVGHSVRVALLALQVARAANANRDQLVQVGTAALLHDIGKSKVPQEILFKQGRLDEAEWHWMAQHPRLGAQILLEQPDLEPSTIGTAFCHHMRPSGDGYPQPALPFQPSALSRLVRVCDVFEALTSIRPYKRALTPCEAYAVMFRAEDDFDQDWLGFFAHTLGIYPQGTRVLLSCGSEGVVVAQGALPHLPVVRLLTGPGGADLVNGEPDEVTLGVNSARTVREVVLHDRSVPVTAPEVADPQILTEPPAHHCFQPKPKP